MDSTARDGTSPIMATKEEFRRLCHRIAMNDPTLTVVALALPPLPPSSRPPSSFSRLQVDENGIPSVPAPPVLGWSWTDADADLFARCMSSNTVVDRVEIPVVNHHHYSCISTVRRGSLDASTTVGAGSDASGAATTAPPRRSGGTNSLLSLSASTRVGRALLHVTEVHLVGTGGRAKEEEVFTASSGSGEVDDDEPCCGLLLHVLLNILGTSKRLWHLRLIDVAFDAAAAVGFWNFMSRTSSLKALDLVRCRILVSSGGVGSGEPATNNVRLLVAPRRPDANATAITPLAEEVPPSAAVDMGNESHVATLTYRAVALNTSIEHWVVDHDALSSTHGAFLFLNSLMSGLIQRQTIQQQGKMMVAAEGLSSSSSKTFVGRGTLRVFQLHLPRLGDDALPPSLGHFLETTAAKEIRVHGGGARSLHDILRACGRNFVAASSTSNTSRALQLKGCIVNPGDMARLCELISRDTALSELVLHEMDVGKDGVYGLARALSSPEASLQVLDLFDIRAGSPSKECDAHVGSVLREALQSNHKLRVLKLGEVTFGSPAGGDALHLVETLKDCPTLREVDLFHVQNLDLQLLASSCASLTRLGLVLCCCGIGPHRLSQFLTTLHSHATHLSDLDLSSNRFGNSEAVVVSVFVKRSTTLCRLALDNNDITDGGAALMFHSVSKHPTMEELSLSGNRLGGPAVRALLDSLPTMQLRHLSLWWDNDDKDSPTAARALIQKLASNSTLVGLNLENSVGRTYRPVIEYYLYRNRLHPWLNENNIGTSMSPPLSSSLWPQALERLSRKDASVAYFVMREKLSTWKTYERIHIN